MTNQTPELVSLTIDGTVVQVPKGTTVYTAAKQLAIEIPIFCYQDRMPPFGACRVCLVEVENMPKLQTSCTLEATNGMVVRTQAQMATKAREEILEFLLINHPLDCPICDRGGECPLQDQAYKFGPGKSRFFEDKRHFEKPLHLGPVLTLDRERCITCARCTRFGDIVAGDHGLEFIDRGYKTEVGTADGQAPKSKYIGNTIMICPVGALTSTVYRFRARPWDNLATETTCTLCPVGCSMILDSRDGEIMRTRSKENRNVNDIWLCDKGWFGYEFSSSDERLKEPLIRKSGVLTPVSWDEAFSYVATKMQQAKPEGKLAALGGTTLTIEENYLLQKLMRGALGVDHVDYRLGEPLHEEIQAGMEIEIGACEELSTIILLGVDITEEFPVLWLRIKQALNKGAKCLFAGHFAPEVARYIQTVHLHPPGEELTALNKLKNEISDSKCAIFVGRQYLATANRSAIVSELLSWKKAQPHLSVNLLEGRGNSMGARLAGMYPQKQGLNAEQIIQTAATGGWGILYVVGCDAASKVPSKLWAQARKNTECLIVQDLFLTKTAKEADVVLPTVSFIEKGGSFLNIEGRVQKLKPGKSIPKGVYSDSYIFVRIAQRLGYTLMIDEPFLDSLKPNHRIISPNPKVVDTRPKSAVHEGLRASFAPALFDRGVRMRHNEQLVQLARPVSCRLHPDEARKRGLIDGGKVAISSGEASLTTTVTFDISVALETLVLPLGFDTFAVHEFGTTLLNGLPVEIRNLLP